MTTPRELITGALRLINVIQANESPTANDVDISFTSLNNMLDSWSNEALSIYTMNPYVFTFQVNKKEYTLGVGGDWDTDRPMELQRMYVIYDNGSQLVEIPIRAQTEDQFGAIGVKNFTSTFPFKYYDNGDFPLRTITVWPIPNTAKFVKLWLWQPLINVVDLDTPIVFPQGYERALRFALAVEVATEFGKDVPENVRSIARMSKGVVKRINSKKIILKGDIALAPEDRKTFNYVTGDTIPQ